MQLYQHVYQIQSLFGGRNVFQYLFVADNSVLIDTGIAGTPDNVIFPYMEKLKLEPEKLTLAITTHADLDHQAGNGAIKARSTQTLLACGDADRELVESPRRLFDDRYNYLQSDHGVGFGEPDADAGQPLHIDLTFSGGERIRLKDDWALEVLHVPGHSHGHLAVYDKNNKAAFIGDAVHGHGCPFAEGGIAIPVTYYYVDIYLNTLRYLESLDVERVYSGHWPAMTGEQFRDFISESRQTVEVFDRAILSGLKASASALTLKECIDAVSNAIGDWPKDSWTVAMFSVNGHLERLEQMQKVRAIRGTRPVRWALA